MNRNGKRIIFGAMSLFALVAVLLQVHVILKEKKLFEGYHTTTGIFGALSWQQRGIHYFTYSIEGVNYEGSSKIDSLPDLGDQVIVYYSPDDPSLSSLRRPEPAGKAKWLMVIYFTIFSAVTFCLSTGCLGFLASSHEQLKTRT